MRLTLPREYVKDVTQRMGMMFGEYKLGPGRHGYGARRQFAYGAFVTWTDEGRAECCVELQGATCQRLPIDSLLEFITWVYDKGGKASRIDVRSDFKGEAVGLIDLVREACEDRQLCRCKRWKPEEPRSNTGEYLGRGVNLGKRGKDGSGRYVRVYDKGLETGEAPARTWERWETEFCKDAADQVARLLIESDDWKRDALAVALGAVEFRDWTGSRSLARRPLAAWWSAFLGNVKPVLVKVARTPTNLDRYGGWVRRSVLPTLSTMAHEAGTTVESVIDYFMNGHKLKRSESPVVWEYLNELGEIEDHRRAAMKFPSGRAEKKTIITSLTPYKKTV